MKEITTIGIDLAKNVFQLHGVDSNGRVVLRRQLKRKDVAGFFTKLPPSCLVGMEACGTAHHWARTIAGLGHRVKLMPPKYVKAYLKRGKTDAADAEAICEAVTRPSMIPVPVKTVEQQASLVALSTRALLIRQRTQTINALRGHLSEFGIIAAVGEDGVKALVAVINDSGDSRLPAAARRALGCLVTALDAVCREIDQLEQAIDAAYRANPTCRRLASIPGVGPMIASTVVALVGDASQFKSGRAFAAWIGLTPRLDGSGGKVMLGPISKQGHRELRRLLVNGASAVLRHAKRSPDKHPRLKAWLAGLTDRLAFKKAAVALANKLARTIWALLVRGGTYNDAYQPKDRLGAAMVLAA